MSLRHRRGFTIVELLIVVSIIGVLIGLLMPALGAARESARQGQCRHKMRQISFAVQQYLATHKVIPISISPWAEGKNPYPQRNGRGWITGALMFMEERNVEKKLVSAGDFFATSGPMGIRDPSAPNLEAIGWKIPMLACPNDGDTGFTSTTHPDFPGISVAMTNYKGCIGDTQLTIAAPELPASARTTSIFPGTTPDCHADNPCNGLFWRNSYQFAARWDRMRDGSSNTFLLGEDLPRYNQNSIWCYANGDWATCSIPMNYMPDPPKPDDLANAMSFRSLHPRGANFALADGQVRWIKDTIRLSVYRALSTRDNNKVEGAMPNLDNE